MRLAVLALLVALAAVVPAARYNPYNRYGGFSPYSSYFDDFDVPYRVPSPYYAGSRYFPYPRYPYHPDPAYYPFQRAPIGETQRVKPVAVVQPSDKDSSLLAILPAQQAALASKDETRDDGKQVYDEEALKVIEILQEAAQNSQAADQDPQNSEEYQEPLYIVPIDINEKDLFVDDAALAEPGVADTPQKSEVPQPVQEAVQADPEEPQPAAVEAEVQRDETETSPVEQPQEDAFPAAEETEVQKDETETPAVEQPQEGALSAAVETEVQKDETETPAVEPLQEDALSAAEETKVKAAEDEKSEAPQQDDTPVKKDVPATKTKENSVGCLAVPSEKQSEPQARINEKLLEIAAKIKSRALARERQTSKQ